MKHVFVMNPIAGTRLARNVRKKIDEVCKKTGADYMIHFTLSETDGAKYIKELLDSDTKTSYRIYACGGDGTVSDMAGAVYGHDNAELALIPIGSGNDFARNFGTQREFCDIEDYLRGSAVEVDLIKYNDSIAINEINMGFDCEVVVMMERNRGKPFMNSSLGYTLCVFACLVKMPHGHVTFTCEDGTVRESNFLLSMLGNGAYYGGGYKAASRADLQDGYLEWIEVSPDVKRSTFISIVSAYKKGTLLDQKETCERVGIKCVRVKKITIESAEGTEMCVDGEIKPLDRVTVESLPRAIKFALPEKLYNRFTGDKRILRKTVGV